MSAALEPGSAAVRAARLDVISRLADDLAHEIKNPLNAVVINLAVLRTRVEKGNAEGALERADVVEREVLRAHDLVDRLLRLARPAEDDPVEVMLGHVLADVVPLVALQAKLARVTLQVADASEVRLLARPATLRAALLALVGDAVTRAREDGPPVMFGATRGEGGASLHVALSSGFDPTPATAVLAAAAGGRLEGGEATGTATLWLPAPGA